MACGSDELVAMEGGKEGDRLNLRKKGCWKSCCFCYHLAKARVEGIFMY